MGADEAEQQLECIQAAGTAEETPFHLSENSSKVLVKSKVEGSSGVMAFWMHFRCGSSHPGTQVGVPARQSIGGHIARGCRLAQV